MSRFASWASAKSELSNEGSRRGCNKGNSCSRLECEQTLETSHLNVLPGAVVLSKAEAFQCQIQKAHAGYKGSQCVKKSHLSCPHYKAVSTSTLLADTGGYSHS